VEPNCFFICVNAKKSLVLNVIPNINFEIRSQSIIANTITLNANHSRIQQFHGKFCWLIKKIELYG
jgi:hypothetical protein